MAAHLHYDVTAETGSGLAIGLHTQYDISIAKKDVQTWAMLVEGILPFIGDEKTIKCIEGIGESHKGVLCVYVCSRDMGLTNVKGTITYDAP